MMRSVAVLGAGTMGHGIAQVFATAGFDVHLADTTLEIAAHGIARIRQNLEEGVRRGKLSAEAMAPTSSSRRCRNGSN
jgi:3-hydroxyacyl-CoA dehydrogenase